MPVALFLRAVSRNSSYWLPHVYFILRFENLLVHEDNTLVHYFCYFTVGICRLNNVCKENSNVGHPWKKKA